MKYEQNWPIERVDSYEIQTYLLDNNVEMIARPNFEILNLVLLHETRIFNQRSVIKCV